jgi:hypothetical protein
VGENAFSACAHLETVTYADPGDAEDWDAVNIENGNEPLLQAEIRLHTHTPGAAKTENEVAATCEGAGSYDTVTYCTACGKELSRVTVPTDPLGHDYGPVTYVWAEDCSYCTAKRVCRRDASHVAEEKSDPSTAERAEPGCTEDGKIVYTAFFANESLDTQVKTVVLPKLGHNYQPTVTAPTCTDKGYTTYLCSRCGDSYVDDETPANGHTPGQPVTENETPATCEAAGSYDAVVYCKDCGAELSRTTSTIDPLGHDYGAVVYEWAADCSVCVAKKVCKRDASHVWQEKSNKPVEKRTEPTCTEAGSIVYTASFNNKSLETQVKTVILPAKGHTPGKPVKENEVAATEETPSAWDEVVYCAVCKAELSRTHKTGEKLPVSIMPGDVDGDGYVKTGDARMALRIAIGLEPEITPETKAYKAADADRNGKVTTADARYILRRAIGLSDPDIW